MPNNTPIIVTAFANDYIEGTHLSYLSDEIAGITNTTQAQQLKAAFDVVPIYNATLEKIAETLNNPNYKDRIVAFHYGGHADGKNLMLQTTTGESKLEDANTLAEFLGKQERLQLVFLNGCSTKGQVEKLMEYGIPYIIATDRSIEDFEATRFAIRLYEVLAEGERNIPKLFEEAQKVLKKEDIQKKIERKLYNNKKRKALGEFPWGLYQSENTENEDLGEWFVNQNVTFLTPPPPKPPTFVGRQSDLKVVHQLLKDNDNVVLVNGIGGIGKSTLAQAYWHKHQHQYHYIAWLTVINNNVQEAFINSDLEAKLDIKIPEKSTIEKRYKIIQTKLSELKGINLMVLDNINEPDAVHQFELPNWKVMVTSRANIQHYIHHTVGILDMKDAKTLFLTYFPQAEKQMDLLEKLLEAIGRHTLTIELLAKTLNELRGMGYGLTELYKDLEERGLLNPSRTQEIYTDYQKGKTVKFEELIAAIFDIQGLSEYEQWLLLQFAVLPSIYISFGDISDFLQIEGEKVNDFGNTLNGLVRKGWLEDSFDEEKRVKSFKLHQVIQEVVREKLKPNSKNCDSLIKSLILMLRIEVGDTSFAKKYYTPYAAVLLLHLSEEENNEIATLYNNLSTIYKDLGRYKDALLYNKKSICIFESISDVKYALLADACNNIAIIFNEIGDYKNALAFHQKDISILESILDLKDPSLANAYNSIAVTYQDLKMYSKALEYSQKSLAIREEIFSPYHPHLATTYNTIAINHHLLENYNEALYFHLKTMAIQKKVFGDKSFNLAISYNNIAMTYSKMKYHEESIQYYQKTIKIFNKILGTEHPYLGKTYGNMAKSHYDFNNFITAKKNIDISVRILSNVFSSEHPHLNEALQRQQKINQALQNQKT
ncbi:MAG: tetratricopeptide repeat protein [Chitinophagales bacterium]